MPYNFLLFYEAVTKIWRPTLGWRGRGRGLAPVALPSTELSVIFSPALCSRMMKSNAWRTPQTGLTIADHSILYIILYCASVLGEILIAAVLLQTSQICTYPTILFYSCLFELSQQVRTSAYFLHPAEFTLIEFHPQILNFWRKQRPFT